jgi:glycosyltransferase involved in cell wall biosynthesis
LNILFLARSLHVGGAERQLVSLASGLHARGHQVAVAVFYTGGPLDADLTAAGVPLLDLKKKGRWDTGVFIASLIRLVRTIRPDILHGYLGTPNVLTAMLKPFCPGVRMVWGVRASNMDLSCYDRTSRFNYLLERRLARFANKIIVNSKAGLTYAASVGFPKKTMEVVHNGVDVERFCPDEEAGKAVRREWEVGDDECLIGHVARMDPMKDHPMFLRAAAALPHGELTKNRFVCVGDGSEPQQRELRVLGKSLGLENRLIWAGPRADMPAVFNALDILCSSSLYGEGFPNVLGEAMACGVPCVATDVGDSALVLGETGRVVPPGAFQLMAEALEQTVQALPNERETLARTTRERIVAQFSREAMIRRTEEILEGVLKK